MVGPPRPSFAMDNYPIGIRWPHDLRRPLERAAADRGESVAAFIEGAVLREMATSGISDTSPDSWPHP
jgi:hypothetical protein